MRSFICWMVSVHGLLIGIPTLCWAGVEMYLANGLMRRPPVGCASTFTKSMCLTARAPRLAPKAL